MLCVECKNPDIGALFKRYKNENITLTICDECGKIADMYIEYDNVILFLDLLLLRPQAYRHLTYNVTTMELNSNETNDDNLKLHSWWNPTRISDFLIKYKKIIRLLTLMTLFEVYITWAYEEKKDLHSEGVLVVLGQEIYIQYLYFILKLILEGLVQYAVIIFLFQRKHNWGLPERILKSYKTNYKISILLMTLLVSNFIKLFPILMLIWPVVKTTTSSSIINVLAFLNTLEALKIITDMTYLSIFIVLMISVLLKHTVPNLILNLLLDLITGSLSLHLLRAQYHRDTEGLIKQVFCFTNMLSMKKGLASVS